MPAAGLSYLFAPRTPASDARSAIEKGNTRKLTSLIAKHPELIGNAGIAAELMQTALLHDKTEAAALLLERGAALPSNHNDVLARTCSTATMDLLFAHGVDAEHFDLSKLSAAYPVNAANDVALLERIVAHHAPLEAGDAGAGILLSRKVQSHHETMVAAILALGIDPAGDPRHPAMLELARSCDGGKDKALCEAETLSIAQLLLSHGADVNAVEAHTSDCSTALAAAKAKALPRLAALLETAGAIDNPPAQQACLAARSGADKH